MTNNKQTAILLVHPDNLCAELADILKNSGYRCFIAQSPKAASQIIENEGVQFGLIESPLTGGQDGNLFSDLHEQYPPLTLIAVITGGIMQPQETVLFGADHYLTVPGDIQRLPEILAVATERRRLALDIRDRFDHLDRERVNIGKEVEKSRDLLEQNFFDTIKAFIGLLEIRDLHMGSHCKRVATFSRALSEHYDLNERVRHEIEVGALLHDIGKISIPDKLLMKTRNFFAKAEMTTKERDLYQKHPVIGQESVEMVNQLTNVGAYIRHHHERFDGSGFPDRLSGYYIPLGARIITIADIYDKIVYSLPKNRQSEAELLFIRYVEKNRGKVFDPEVSDKMITLMKEFKRAEYAGERRVSVGSLAPGMVLSRDVYTKSGVLVISQYERITGNEIARLNRFLTANMIMDGIYIFMTASGDAPASVTGMKFSPVSADRDTNDLNLEETIRTIDSVRDLYTIPEVNESISARLQDAQYTRDDLTAALLRCPVISLRILRIANSPFFKHAGGVRTVPEAVKVLGMNETRQAALTTPVLDTDQTKGVFDRTELWTHLMGCGVISGIIARHLGINRVDEYFTAGLYHDIGKLACEQLFPQQFRKVLAMVEHDSMFYRKAERMVFGESHPFIGAYLLTKSNIPEEIVDAVKYHHAPMDSAADITMTSAVHLADIIAHLLHIGESGERAVPKLEPFAEQKLGISLAELESLIPEIDRELKQSREMVFGKSGRR
jgi:putative nucleotidyltransferase with HDIG domain